MLVLILPIPVVAQDEVVVQGRVFPAGGIGSVQNAIVELEGHGAVLTGAGGMFSFDGVEPGGYTLRVDAFGFASDSRFLSVSGDTTVAIALRIVPFLMDTLVVEPERIDIDGRVRDPSRELWLVKAEVLTNQVPGALTDSHGRFDIDDVFADVPLRMLVRTFGYLPVDTIILPDEDEDYLFELVPDTLMERMIEVQVERLEVRAAGRRAAVMAPMDREDLLRYAGRADLLTTVEFEYGSRVRRVQCVVIDEQYRAGLSSTLSSLWTMLPEELERVEFLFRGAMLRVYTRTYMAEMVSRDIELRRPYMNRLARPPICR